jgi:hypothetical protein
LKYKNKQINRNWCPRKAAALDTRHSTKPSCAYAPDYLLPRINSQYLPHLSYNAPWTYLLSSWNISVLLFPNLQYHHNVNWKHWGGRNQACPESAQSKVVHRCSPFDRFPFLQHLTKKPALLKECLKNN